MSAGIFGRKLGMTQIFDKEGSILPVTILRAEPCQISQIKTTITDGYNAIQVAYVHEKLNKIVKPQLGHLKKTNSLKLESFLESMVFEKKECNDFFFVEIYYFLTR